MSAKSEYPRWICFDCAKLYGRREGGICTVHPDKCGICGHEKAVTEPRDFGGLIDGWQDHDTKGKA